MYSVLKNYIGDDNISDILVKLDYNSLVNFINVDELYNKFLDDSFWKKYCTKYTVEECIQNNWYVVLYYKIKFGEIISRIYEISFYKNSNNFNVFNNSNSQCFKVIMTYTDLDFSVNNNLDIGRASMYGYTKIVKLLLADKKIDPSTRDNQAVVWASYRGHLGVVKLLLKDSRVDPSIDNNALIEEVFECGHSKIVKLLLKDPRVISKLSKKDINFYSKM